MTFLLLIRGVLLGTSQIKRRLKIFILIKNSDKVILNLFLFFYRQGVGICDLEV